MILKRGLTRSWSFSGLATMVRIVLMYYVDFYSLFNHPEKDWEMLLNQSSNLHPIASLFD
ncbi:MAG: transposase, partial [Bacteroidales bacterium]|nr:transposase [Bacteroidales bacterium]